MRKAHLANRRIPWNSNQRPEQIYIQGILSLPDYNLLTEARPPMGDEY